jgi:hypothetical protein
LLVTRISGIVAGAQNFMPSGVAEALRRTLGLNHLFTDAVDAVKRKSYEECARNLS